VAAHQTEKRRRNLQTILKTTNPFTHTLNPEDKMPESMLGGANGEDTSSGTVPTGSLAGKSTATPSDNNFDSIWRSKAPE
jgi:hypothetical protein